MQAYTYTHNIPVQCSFKWRSNNKKDTDTGTYIYIHYTRSMHLQMAFKQQKRYRCKHIYIHILYSFNVALSDVQTAKKIPMQAHIYNYTILDQCSL